MWGGFLPTAMSQIGAQFIARCVVGKYARQVSKALRGSSTTVSGALPLGLPPEHNKSHPVGPLQGQGVSRCVKVCQVCPFSLRCDGSNLPSVSLLNYHGVRGEN